MTVIYAVSAVLEVTGLMLGAKEFRFRRQLLQDLQGSYEGDADVLERAPVDPYGTSWADADRGRRAPRVLAKVLDVPRYGRIAIVLLVTGALVGAGGNITSLFWH